jgi:hypothetical protein
MSTFAFMLRGPVAPSMVTAFPYDDWGAPDVPDIA